MINNKVSKLNTNLVFEIPATLSHAMKQGNTLIIGTSFPGHIELVLHHLQEEADPRSLLLALSDQVIKTFDTSTFTGKTIILPGRGHLSITFGWQHLAQIRSKGIKSVVLLYHDAAYLRNRRAELLGLMCRAKNYFLFNIEGSCQRHSFLSFSRKFLLWTLQGRVGLKIFFSMYLSGVKMMALCSKMGRRLLFSRWTPTMKT